MAAQALLIEVRWPDGRFHGVRDAATAEWPPSPFRLFQALVAGAYGGRWVGEARADKDRAFAWLERQAAPVILEPSAKRLRPLTYFVPNNDLDTKDGDPARVGEIRAAKTVRTHVFDGEAAVGYLWSFDGEAEEARRLAALAERLHTLGHGVDAAYAFAEVLDAQSAQERIEGFVGRKLKPSPGAVRSSGASTPCPARGSLESLHARHAAVTRRFERVGRGARARNLFRQPSQAHFRTVAYAQPPARRLYELRTLQGDFAPWPLEDAYGAATAVRDLLAGRLGKDSERVERFVVGRTAGAADVERRVRILPLPSIGMIHTDPAIRRVLIELGPDCPVSLDEVDWALAGQKLLRAHAETGEVQGEARLTPSNDLAMSLRYRTDRGARGWRSVTPLALPEAAARRRIDPDRLKADSRAEGKDAAERSREETQAVEAVVRALRHAGVSVPVAEVHVQREPLADKEARAERFAASSRFAKERLWHAEIRFTAPVAGPLALGDGRFCGLGLMAPVREQAADISAFEVTSNRPISPADRAEVLAATRRALMSLAQDQKGDCPLLFSGHEPDGAPARSGGHRHVYLALSGDEALTLWVVAPWRVDRSWNLDPRDKLRHMFAAVVSQLASVRAGPLGVLALKPMDGAQAQVCGPSRTWVSATPYRPNRHGGRRETLEAKLATDIELACTRLGRPRPAVEIIDMGAGGEVRAKLRFARAISGPLLLGRDAHAGGGLFLPG